MLRTEKGDEPEERTLDDMDDMALNRLLKSSNFSASRLLTKGAIENSAAKQKSYFK